MGKLLDKFKATVEEKKDWYKFPLTFWELVEQLGWKENNFDYKVCCEKLKSLCNNNKYIMDYFNKIRCSYRDALKNAIDDYELKEYGARSYGNFFKGGDDSFDDLCNHIIGLGKETTFSVLENPKLASEFFDSFKESFAYCFHYDVK